MILVGRSFLYDRNHKTHNGLTIDRLFLEARFRFGAVIKDDIVAFGFAFCRQIEGNITYAILSNVGTVLSAGNR